MKILPNRNSTKGFTLIELLIVVTILGVLSLIGVAAFRGLQNRGNDEKRMADLNAVASALEVNKTSSGYQLLADSQFQSGKIPADPTSTKVYCIMSASSGSVGSKPAAWAGTTCPGGYGALSPTTPTANSTIWMVCATLQNGSSVECRTSAQ